MPCSDDDAPDLRLEILIYGTNVTVSPRVERFPPDAWDQAIDRARELAAGRERLRVVIVRDAFGTRIAEFTSAWIYRPQRIGS